MPIPADLANVYRRGPTPRTLAAANRVLVSGGGSAKPGGFDERRQSGASGESTMLRKSRAGCRDSHRSDRLLASNRKRLLAADRHSSMRDGGIVSRRVRPSE